MDNNIKLKHSVKIGFSTLLMAALLLAGSSSTYSAIYKWQDESGGWHFSEVPPDDKPVQKVDVRVTPPSSAETTTVSNENSDQTTDAAAPTTESKALTKSKQVAAEDRALRKKNCQIARDNLTSLQRTRIRYNDRERGEERYLTEEERQQWIVDSKKAATENCANP